MIEQEIIKVNAKYLNKEVKNMNAKGYRLVSILETTPAYSIESTGGFSVGDDEKKTLLFEKANHITIEVEKKLIDRMFKEMAKDIEKEIDKDILKENN